MPADSTQIAPRTPTARSRVTNGTALFVEQVDGRGPIARRYRDILGAVVADQGGQDQCSEVILQLARRFAALSVQAEAMEATLARGEVISLTDHASIASTLTRLSTRLGIGRKAKEIVPTLEGYLAKKGATP